MPRLRNRETLEERVQRVGSPAVWVEGLAETRRGAEQGAAGVPWGEGSVWVPLNHAIEEPEATQRQPRDPTPAPLFIRWTKGERQAFGPSLEAQTQRSIVRLSFGSLPLPRVHALLVLGQQLDQAPRQGGHM